VAPPEHSPTPAPSPLPHQPRTVRVNMRVRIWLCRNVRVAEPAGTIVRLQHIHQRNPTALPPLPSCRRTLPKSALNPVSHTCLCSLNHSPCAERSSGLHSLAMSGGSNSRTLPVAECGSGAWDCQTQTERAPLLPPIVGCFHSHVRESSASTVPPQHLGLCFVLCRSLRSLSCSSQVPALLSSICCPSICLSHLVSTTVLFSSV